MKKTRHGIESCKLGRIVNSYFAVEIQFLLLLLSGFFPGVEIKTNQMKTSNSSAFRAYYTQGVSHHHLYFGRDSTAGRGVGNFIVEKGEDFLCILTALSARGNCRGDNQKWGTLCHLLVRGSYLIVFIEPLLETGAKIRDAVGY